MIEIGSSEVEVNVVNTSTDTAHGGIEAVIPGVQGELRSVVDEASFVEISEKTLTKDFVAEYTERTAPQTDSPTSYHRLVAWVLLSTAVGREATVQVSFGPIYLNLWGLCLGPSSVTRKSTAMRIGVDLLWRACPKAILPNDMTPEAMVKVLGRGRRGLFYRDEYAGFLADTKKDYMRGTREFMNAIYDCPDRYERELVKGRTFVRDVYVTHLSGTTIERFSKEITDLDFESGFAVRFLYAIETGEDIEPHPVGLASDDFEGSREGLESHLRAIEESLTRSPAECIPSEDALELFNEWYVPRATEIRKGGDSLLIALYERYQVMAFKFAALYEIDEAVRTGRSVDSEVTISGRSMDKAIDEIEWFLQQGKMALDLVTSAQSTSLYAKFMRIGRRHAENGKIQRSIWLKHSKLKAKQMQRLVQKAVAEGELKRLTMGGAECYDFL